MTLKDAMAEAFAGWEGDLPPDWRAALGSVGDDFSRIDADLEFEAWEPIFPVRRGRHFPGQPKGAHALAAFDGIAPQEVRCMILGQDPYPEPGFATGRAFEAGNLASWNELDKMFSKSIRAYMQLIAAARTGNQNLSESFERWPDVRQMLCDPDCGFEGPSAIGDRWVRQGVLLLNASLTLSRFKVDVDPHQARGHLPFWRPLMLKVIATLRERDQPIVFIGFGDAAADILAEAGLSECVSGNCALILRDHPAFAEHVLGRENPFLLCNSYLEARGASPVAW
ncbi:MULTISPECIES: uracil-DNA glycosylase [Rhizobium]|uniref:Uracil-DNA glycosylase n=1 Tax=Rhizobium miluonense TaxID=411945 RepID=A0A1C3W5Z3_9HYPH|nr:uracil-DNA glycosylase [Rhizobium miluonense]SCB35503.1 Uracil-DNA glycosylase [Rhizobium miluonense]